ncbi:MAG: acyl carrier protein [Clostridia bacterium]|nr:acyl carrier protein [Clostridia bacterium]MDY3785405.1 acyl carrier protein [Eubacteriales bacterium]
MFEKVRELLAKQLKLKPEKITMESTISGDLEADSIDILELLMTLEEENGIVIPDEKLAGFKTVGDIVRYLESL